jgi:hypothetical protein
VARHNLEESLKTVSTLLDDLVGEPVGEDLSEAWVGRVREGWPNIVTRNIWIDRGRREEAKDGRRKRGWGDEVMRSWKRREERGNWDEKTWGGMEER